MTTALVLMFLLVLATAIGVVYSKHESRKLFVQLESLKKERDQMNIEWGRLQLEQSTYATHGRIERIAQKKLNMHIPPSNEVVIVRP